MNELSLWTMNLLLADYCKNNPTSLEEKTTGVIESTLPFLPTFAQTLNLLPSTRFHSSVSADSEMHRSLTIFAIKDFFKSIIVSSDYMFWKTLKA